MFFSGRKQAVEKQAAENAAYFSGIIEDTKQKITQIEKISDAGERYLAFAELEGKIRQLAVEAAGRVKAQKEGRPASASASDFACFGMFFGGMAIAGTIAVTGGAAVIGLAGLAMIPGGLVVGIVGDNADIKRREKIFFGGKDSFCGSLEELLQNTVRQRDAILQNELSGLAASGKVEELCDKVPAVKDVFAKAAIKEGILRPVARLDKPRPSIRKGN